MIGTSLSRRRWLTAAAGLGGAAAACNPTGPAAPAGQTGKAHAPVTLTVWQHPLFAWRDDVGKEITDPLLAANPWLTIDAVELVGGGGGAGREKVLAAAAGGTPPDTYTSGSYWDQQDFVD